MKKFITVLIYILFPPAMFWHFKRKSLAIVAVHEETCRLMIEEAKKKAAELTKGNWLIRPEHETEFVFECGGVSYYKFINEQKIPAKRAMSALDIYAELEQKTDILYHKSGYTAIIEYLKKGENIKAGSVAMLALERMQHISNRDLVYKLASVLFFDKNENPYDYDYDYADKKIEIWKANNLDAFFFNLLVPDVIPCLDSYGLDLPTYSRLQEKELIQQLENRLSILSEDNNNKELLSSIKSQVEVLKKQIASIG
jgi:hypothetical protein